MKKFIFMSGQELSTAVEEVYLQKGEAVKVETSFCEVTENDIVIIKKNDSTITMTISDLQDELSAYLGHAITHYDEIEVGDFGVGFAFFF